jgi:hypothetical protein
VKINEEGFVALLAIVTAVVALTSCADDAPPFEDAAAPDAIWIDAAPGPPSCGAAECAGGWYCAPCDHGGLCTCSDDGSACALECAP